jgi:hypothetical protein
MDFLRMCCSRERDNNGLIEICEVAKYLASQLPERSLKANFKPQVPQIKVIGADFALLNRLDIADIN